MSANWRSKRYIDESNLSWMPSVGLLDLRAGVQGGNWDATLYVENVLDEDQIQSAIRFIDLGTTESFAPQRDYLAVLPKPRTAGLRIALKF
jgi:outer membrane receptor protein involved in Fe transport